MSPTYVIEIGDRAAGLVSQESRGVRFHSALRNYDALDGKLFATSSALERALRLQSGKRFPATGSAARAASK